MGLLSFFGLQRRSDSVSNNELMRILLGGNTTKAGQNVTVDTSFGIPALWAGFRMLGHTMASLPLEVFERQKGGEYPAVDHPIYELLTKQPSQLYNAFNWKEMMQVNLESFGNAYARIYRKKAEVYELEWLDPNNVTVLYNRTKRIKKYKVRYGGDASDEEILDHDQILHLMIMSKDGLIGRSPINACKEALGMMLSAQEYGAEFFANGAVPSGIFSTPAELTPAQVTQLQNLWKEKYQGSKNAGNVAIMHSGARFEQISAKPVDADFVKTMKWTGEQVAQMLGIPPHILGVLDRSTNNNIEQQSTDLVVHGVRPRAKCWEVELNTKLFLTPETRKRFHIRYNLDSLLRGDTAARGEFYSKLFNIGVLSPNDIRLQEHMNARPGGDEYFVQVNMGGNQTKTQQNEQ